MFINLVILFVFFCAFEPIDLFFFKKKEMQWWNKEVVAFLKEKQRLFKLWEVPKKCKKGCRCRKTGRRNM